MVTEGERAASNLTQETVSLEVAGRQSVPPESVQMLKESEGGWELNSRHMMFLNEDGFKGVISEG